MLFFLKRFRRLSIAFVLKGFRDCQMLVFFKAILEIVQCF